MGEHGLGHLRKFPAQGNLHIADTPHAVLLTNESIKESTRTMEGNTVI